MFSKVSVVTDPYYVFRVTKSRACICIHCLNYFHKVQMKWECLCLCIVHSVSRSCQWHAIVLINSVTVQWLPAAVLIPQQSRRSLFPKTDANPTTTPLYYIVKMSVPVLCDVCGWVWTTGCPAWPCSEPTGCEPVVAWKL